MSLLSQLMRFSIGTERWHAAPFSLKIKKSIWSVATDNHILFAVKQRGAAAGKDYPEDLEEMLTKKAYNPVEISLPELKKWAGKPPVALVPDGEVLLEHQGVLLDQVIDRRKLAYLFAKVTVPVMDAWVLEPGVLVFEQPKKWRAFLAGLDDKAKGKRTEFPIKAPEKPLSAIELSEMVGS